MSKFIAPKYHIRKRPQAKFVTDLALRFSIQQRQLWLVVSGTLLVCGVLIILVSNAISSFTRQNSPITNESIKFDYDLHFSQPSHLSQLSHLSQQQVIVPLVVPQTKQPIITSSHDKNLAGPINKPQIKQITVKPRDNLSSIFGTLGLNAKQLHKIVKLGKITKPLRHLRPGQQLSFSIYNNQLESLIFNISPTKELHIRYLEGKFSAEEIIRQPETRITHATSTILSSLFLAGQKAGLNDSIIMELVNIFSWDIDFLLDIRKGDKFTLIYEEQFLDGEKFANGTILAAEFINRGKPYRAIRYTDPKGNTAYYTPSGKNLRKTFLRTPVAFSRISSGFGKRYHPVLNRMRMHQGVDYAAPRGTPIKATANGKISFIGRKGGYGKTVIIKHKKRYQTLYAHMSGFKRGLWRGKSIKQGQIIGYIGSTGLATGPHLHYEFRINNRHRNPLKVKFPAAKPIQTRFRDDFNTKTKNLVTRLNLINRHTLASIN